MCFLMIDEGLNIFSSNSCVFLFFSFSWEEDVDRVTRWNVLQINYSRAGRRYAWNANFYVVVNRRLCKQTSWFYLFDTNITNQTRDPFVILFMEQKCDSWKSRLSFLDHFIPGACQQSVHKYSKRNYKMFSSLLRKWGLLHKMLSWKMFYKPSFCYRKQ